LGSIKTRIGTYTLSLCANALKKPVYCVAEHFKFYRSFPLRQKDLPDEAISSKNSKLYPCEGKNIVPVDIESTLAHFTSPLCDFTPSNLINFIITDSGIMTPSAVSDELIQMFAL
jgi:translation initiation factor eIF-2B subunit alpha